MQRKTVRFSSVSSTTVHPSVSKRNPSKGDSPWKRSWEEWSHPSIPQATGTAAGLAEGRAGFSLGRDDVDPPSLMAPGRTEPHLKSSEGGPGRWPGADPGVLGNPHPSPGLPPPARREDGRVQR